MYKGAFKYYISTFVGGPKFGKTSLYNTCTLPKSTDLQIGICFGWEGLQEKGEGSNVCKHALHTYLGLVLSLAWGEGN